MYLHIWKCTIQSPNLENGWSIFFFFFFMQISKYGNRVENRERLELFLETNPRGEVNWMFKNISQNNRKFNNSREKNINKKDRDIRIGNYVYSSSIYSYLRSLFLNL